jgi:hypothetical protein
MQESRVPQNSLKTERTKVEEKDQCSSVIDLSVIETNMRLVNNTVARLVTPNSLTCFRPSANDSRKSLFEIFDVTHWSRRRRS